MENAEIAEIAEDAPAEGPAPVPAPAPAATLEIVHEQPYSKSKKVNIELWETSQPVHIVTFTYKHYFNLD